MQLLPNGIQGGNAKVEISLSEVGSLIAALMLAKPSRLKGIAELAETGQPLAAATVAAENADKLLAYLTTLSDAMEVGPGWDQADLDELQIRAALEWPDDDKLRQTDEAPGQLHDGEDN